MDLLIEKGDKRTYLSRYKVITTSFEESAPSVNRNNTQIQYRNGNVDFGGWNEAKTIDYVGYYRADDLEDEEYLRERIYALLSDPDGYYITQLKNDNDDSFERPGETSGDYFDKQVNRPSHKRFYVYASSLESELVGSYGGHVLYKISATFTTMKLPYGESVPRDLDVKPNVPYIGTNLLKNTGNLSSTSTTTAWNVLFDSSQVYDSGIKSLSGVTAMTFSFNVYVPLNATVGSTVPIQLKGQNPQATNVGTDDYNTLIGYPDYAIKQSDLGKTICVSFSIQTDYKYQSFDTAIADTDSITIRQQTNVSGFVYSKMKLEKGSVATDWSPSPSDPGYNEWYLNTYYNTDNLVIPYAGTVPCNQLEQGFTIEFTAKEAGSSLAIGLNGTELTYSGSIVSGDVFKLSGYEYTKNDISIVKDTNKAYFKLLPGVANKISSNLHGSIRILGYQDLYA